MKTITTLITDHIDIWTAAETEKKSGRGRASGNPGSVYGIKKLRELILDLAVRGKLVPQDANDEPASELLKRIQAEKAKLIAEGKIRKDKQLAAITEDEKPFYLPNGWEWCRFGDLVNICTGKLDANAAIEDGKYPFFTCSQTPSRIDTCSFDIDAVLLAGNGDFNVKYYQGKFDAYQRTYVIEPVIFGLKFCFLLVLAQIEIITKNNRGSAIPYLKIGDLTNPVFALPPLAEQHRIVAKVDELMALCDQLETRHSNAAEAHEKLVSHLLGTLVIPPNPPLKKGGGEAGGISGGDSDWQRISAHFYTLFTTESSIDALKQALLQLAVMGKLVPQDANDEPASELLKRIQTEKAKLIAEGKIKKNKPLPPITDDEKPFSSPQGWAWVKFDHISENSKHALKAGPFGSALKKADYSESGYKIYGQEQVISGDENFGDYFIDSQKFQQLSSCVVKSGDILISLVGTIGRVLALSESCQLGIINPRLVKISLFKEIDRAYFKVIFASPLLRNEMADRSHGGTMDILNLGLLRELVLPLPPLAEQHRIVTKVDALMARCDQLKSRITDARQLQQKLADVLVEQAVA